MKKKIDRLIYWTPRILSILFLLFLALFSLDVLDMNQGFWGTVAGLFIHNIPTFILLIALLVSWKHEIVGGVVFTLAGILYIAMLLRTILMNPPHQWYMLCWSLPIAGPAFLIGILFIVGWFRKKEELKRNASY
jgi:hypothetical protein